MVALVAERRSLWRAAPQTLGSAHGLPVVFVFPRAKHANLVKLTVLCAPGPGKFMRAVGKGQYFHNLLLHIGRFREGFSGTQHHRMERRSWIDYLRLVKTLTSDSVTRKVERDPFGICADSESFRVKALTTKVDEVRPMYPEGFLLCTFVVKALRECVSSARGRHCSLRVSRRQEQPHGK